METPTTAPQHHMKMKMKTNTTSATSALHENENENNYKSCWNNRNNLKMSISRVTVIKGWMASLHTALQEMKMKTKIALRQFVFIFVFMWCCGIWGSYGCCFSFCCGIMDSYGCCFCFCFHECCGSCGRCVGLFVFMWCCGRFYFSLLSEYARAHAQAHTLTATCYMHADPS